MKHKTEHPDVAVARKRIEELRKLHNEHGSLVRNGVITRQEFKGFYNKNKEEWVGIIKSLLVNKETAKHVCNMTAFFQVMDNYRGGDLLNEKTFGDADCESSQGYFYFPSQYQDDVEDILKTMLAEYNIVENVDMDCMTLI